jgi:hypothetical protein
MGGRPFITAWYTEPLIEQIVIAGAAISTTALG